MAVVQASSPQVGAAKHAPRRDIPLAGGQQRLSQPALGRRRLCQRLHGLHEVSEKERER